jgi:hypothetical protein
MKIPPVKTKLATFKAILAELILIQVRWVKIAKNSKNS